jgi:hypothetical protein
VRAGLVRLADISDYDQGVQDLSRGWWLRIRKKADENPVVYERFVRKTEVYHCYVLHRAHEYAARNTDRIDPNDFEDARLCLHLGLNELTAVATNDIALRRCLRATLETLNAMEDTARHTPLQIWDAADFVSRLVPNRNCT